MTCRGKRKDGKPCGAHAVHGSDRCYLHSAGNRASLLGKQGRTAQLVAQQSARPILPEVEPPESLEDLQTLVAKAIAATMTGRLQPKAANAVASLSSVLTGILKATDLAERIAALEAWREQQGVIPSRRSTTR